MHIYNVMKQPALERHVGLINHRQPIINRLSASLLNIHILIVNCSLKLFARCLVSVSWGIG